MEREERSGYMGTCKGATNASEPLRCVRKVVWSATQHRAGRSARGNAGFGQEQGIQLGRANEMARYNGPWRVFGERARRGLLLWLGLLLEW